MKTRTLFLLLLAALTATPAAQAQNADTLLVGDTTNMVLGHGLPYQPYSNCYTQQLVLGSELDGEALITGIDLYCGTPSSVGRMCTIYLANTYFSRLDSLVPFGTQFQVVAVDSLACTPGWNHYEFDTAFRYNGLGNLVVAFNCPYSTSGGDFYGNYTQNISRRRDNLLPTTTTAVTFRNVMRLHTRSLAAPAASCPAPGFRLLDLGSTSVTVGPDLPAPAQWVVECATDGDSAWHTSGLLYGDTAYTLGGLTPLTHYTFRLTAFCADTSTAVYRHLLTNCIPDTIPYLEDFEGMWGIPACWNTVAGRAGTHPGMASHSHSGTRSVQLQGGSVVLPPFDVPVDSLELSFWAKNGTTNASLDLHVGVVSNTLDFSTFVPVDTIAVSRYTSWNPVVVRLDRYNGIPGRIAIRTAIDYITYMYIDDIEVNRLSPCPTITTVNVSQITDTSAVVHWVDTNAAVYEVAYGPAGFTIDSTHTVGGILADSLLLTGLQPYSFHDVYVRSFCGGTYTNWSPARSFRTFCSPLDTLPFFDDFDSYSGYPKASDLPCWRGQVDANTNVIAIPGGGHSGTRVLRWDGNSTMQYAVLPLLDTATIPLNSLQLSFWACNNYYSHQPTCLYVGVMTDPTAVSTFQVVDSVVISEADWLRHDVSFNDYKGSGAYIALTSNPTTSRATVYLDDLLVELEPPCTSVTGVTLTALSATSATLRWNSQAAGTVWQACIDTVATAIPVADTTGITLPECTFEGLATGTPHYVWVRSVCPKGDTSEWEGPLQVVPGVWNMRANRDDSLSLCGVTVYDDGGAEGVFSSQRSTLVIMPDRPGHVVSISGYCNGGGLSILTAYDGIGTSGPVLWTKSHHNDTPIHFGPIVSDAGPITLGFNGSTAFDTYNEGFELEVSCIPDTCIVHHLQLDPTVAATDTTLTLTWRCNGASLYEVEHGPVGFAPGTGTLATTATNSFTIAGLASLDRREVHVRSLCGGGDTSAWVRGIFTTQPCSDAVFRDNFDSTMISDILRTGPIGFNSTPYSYAQTLIDPAHLAGLEAGITALAFRPSNYVEGDHMNNISVWLANVADTNLNNGPIVPDAAHRFVKVIDSADFRHLATTEWQHFPFDHPFLWDGRRRLLVAVLREDGVSGQPTEYSAHYHHPEFYDGTARSYQITSPTPINIDSARHYPHYYAYGSFLTGDIRLFTNTCVLPVCAVPVVESVSGTHESISVSWHGTGSDYELGLSPDLTATGIVSVSGDSYTFTGLQPSTDYRVSLRQNCTADSLGRSDWVHVQFTTDSTAGIPQTTLYTPRVYPNPATSRVTVQSPWPLAVAALTDMIGRHEEVRLTATGNGYYSLDLSNRPQGAYFLTLTAADGRQYTTRLLKRPVATEK